MDEKTTENTPPRRRWFRFSLRTLFVAVTIAAICMATWMGYYAHWKSERQEVRAWVDAQGIGGSFGYSPPPRPGLPWMLRLLGEQPEELILMEHEPSRRNNEPPPAEYRQLVDKVTKLFPEAFVWDLSAKEEETDP